MGVSHETSIMVLILVFSSATSVGAVRRKAWRMLQIHGKRAWLKPGLPWYDPHYPTVFNTTIYPDFMQGGGYILSHGAARAVVDMGKEVGLYSWRREAERMPHQEDVLVAELLRRVSMCKRVALRFTFSIQLSRGVKHVHSKLPTRCGREQMWMHPVNLARIAAVERAASGIAEAVKR
ncbi:hypothetical protein EMIHUDRAFT_200061 [Emiliania huxleyi CCMP1516]|uniref:Hexosyltransferase n=2 Tax=Emiliania huxleyi TaxID=2903 RepID=A0A0D3KUW9_EMIH1|nr:hypothetical protein EMIHUDRAFT_200061 [Emiliania huxleyi CCMP1516]EOD39554.1 hypothetical protein EMIHUDRAFT_200061 [Emiliania huxleyi CCMP1516]|eukprot:XP_005791983.1 hypothetical protein EMIHUDRAFT_200061 [Emiliania huxleyi CCMP1516]